MRISGSYWDSRGHFTSRVNSDLKIVEKEENLEDLEEDENPPNEPEPTAPKPTTTHTGSSLVIPEDAKSSSNVENSRKWNLLIL